MTTEQGHRLIPQHAGVGTNIHPFLSITFLLKGTAAENQQLQWNHNLKFADKAEKVDDQLKRHWRDVNVCPSKVLWTQQSQRVKHDTVQKHCNELKTNSALLYRSNMMPRSQTCGYCWFVWVLEKIQVQQLLFSFPSGRSSIKLSFLTAPCFPFGPFLSFPCTNSLLISHFLWLPACLSSQLSRPSINRRFSRRNTGVIFITLFN